MRAALLLVAVAVACVQAETRNMPESASKQVAPSGLVSVRVAPRKPSERPPLLVLLHGLGSDERDLVGLAGHFDPRFAVRAVRAPNAMEPGRNAWFSVNITREGLRSIDAAQAEGSRQALLRFIDEAVALEHADPERVYLAGFSQGGIMALSVALSEPGRIAGAVCMSGRILPQVAEQPAPPEALAGLPILIVHGRGDEVLPIANARASRETLGRLPVALAYREFDMGHEVSRESIALVSEWLAGRLDGPRRVK